MRNETSLENSKPIINNSSLITAENSSLQSKLNLKKNKIISQRNHKYSNAIVFENRQKEMSHTITNPKDKNSIYLTDVTLSKYRETESYNKTTLESSNINSTTYHDFRRNKKYNQKHSLPNIKNSYRYSKNSPFTCCDFKMNPKLLTRLYNEQLIANSQGPFYEDVDSNKKKLKHHRSYRETKNEFIKKINEIKRFKYEIDLKKEAMEDYKQNIRAQLCGLESTINNITAYKDNLENNFLSKYNKDIKQLERHLLEERLKDDEYKRNLKNLKSEVNSLKIALVKKEKILKNIEKWIILQIFIKEGVEPKNLKESLKKYEYKLIFETPEELHYSLKFKENKNLRLIEIYNRIQKEKEKYKQQCMENEKELENNDQIIGSILTKKESELNSLKSRQLSLKSILNKLKIEKNLYQKENTNKIKRSKSSNNTIINNKNILSYHDSDLQSNELGILYKPIKIKNNIFIYIDCIFKTLLCNNINWPKINSKYIHQMNNSSTTKSQLAVIQMKIIELYLNYLNTSINKKVNSNKKYLLIKEKVCKVIDLYHKKINGNKNKLEQQNYRQTLLNKVKAKNSKVIYLPRGKIEKYNIVNIEKKREEERIKIKKAKKNVDIWDFLYDIPKNEKENNEQV